MNLMFRSLILLPILFVAAYADNEVTNISDNSDNSLDELPGFGLAGLNPLAFDGGLKLDLGNEENLLEKKKKKKKKKDTKEAKRLRMLKRRERRKRRQRKAKKNRDVDEENLEVPQMMDTDIPKPAEKNDEEILKEPQMVEMPIPLKADEINPDVDMANPNKAVEVEPIPVEDPLLADENKPDIANPLPAEEKKPDIANPLPADEKKPDIENPLPADEKKPDIANPLPAAEKKPDFDTVFLGSWKLDSENSGVSAMHLQLMPNNKAVWYDTTGLGPSAIKHNPPFCRPLPGTGGKTDCFAHAIEYDIESAAIRTLRLETNPWCSSGGLSPKGELISTGGTGNGLKSLRILGLCKDCDFQENPTALSAIRWYATQHMLEDGTFALVGGRGVHNYELFPSDQLKFQIKQIALPILFETEDEKEDNLYPFVYLMPDGNLFVFSNYKSIIVEAKTGKTLREFPDLPGGSRNYPSSGMSALLPLKLNAQNEVIETEVIVCGGNKPDAFKLSENPPRTFLPAFKDCGRMSITKPDPKWELEDMPSPRVMGDMLILPNGEILIINGAKAGTSGWWSAETPNLIPVLYSPDKPKGQRFKELAPATIPRMYHSSCAVLPDGQILVAGSNTNSFYDFKAQYPTELRVEKFSPPYLAPELQKHRPVIIENASDKELKYGAQFNVKFELKEEVALEDIKVTMYPPPFTTHGFSHNQRLLILGVTEMNNQLITAMAPPSGKIAPPGYYMLFVVYRGVPSKAIWVHIQ